MKSRVGSITGSVAAMALAVTLSACGGGGGGSAPAAANTATGKFVDGPVAGLGYSSGTTSGLSGTGGSYLFETGKTVKFFVGNATLGEASAQSVMTPLHLVPGSNAATPEVVQMVRFLLSVGTLNTDNSITIPPGVTSAAMQVAPVNVTTLTDAQLDALVKAIKGSSAMLVDAAAATSHMSGCVLEQYQGAYHGGFTGVVGDPNRTWVMTISPSGAVSGYGSNQILVGGVLQNEVITGTMTNGIDFTGAAAGGCELAGKLDVTTGILSGTWWIPNSVPPVGGTFSGTI